tara:strand:- start:414 stop:893 length:480 start_codon:yes stop_codon:yes gene_type:complete
MKQFSIQFEISSRINLLLLLGSSLLAVLALGPGWYADDSLVPFHLHYSFYSWVCHQDPSRSFEFMGAQMAVCSRCIGIYGAFALGFWLKGITARFEVWPDRDLALRLLSLFAGLIGFDVLINALDIWTNTHYSRLLLGVGFGLMASVFITSNDSFSSNA